MRSPSAWFADWLIMRSLRDHFRAVYLCEQEPLEARCPAIVFANHHYWWDGHFLHLLAREWRPGKSMVWMKELTPFPPFRALGAMPFPEDDAVARARTIRQTVKALRSTAALLFLFPEGDMHPAPDLGPFHRSLFWLHEKLPGTALMPAAIRIVEGIHQYPEAFILAGRPFACEEPNSDLWLGRARDVVRTLLEELDELLRGAPRAFRCILAGRLSIDERRCSGNRDRGPRPRCDRVDR